MVLLWSPAWENKERDREALEFLDRATGVWFSGGQQERLEEWVVEKSYGRRIREVVRRGGVVGGTSAGAGIQSRPCILDGSASAPSLGLGLGLLTRAIVEQHLDRPGRLRRLLSAISGQDHAMIGIGVQEDTALVIHDGQMEVLGRGRAVFFLHVPHGDEYGYVADSLMAGERGTIESDNRRGLWIEKESRSTN